VVASIWLVADEYVPAGHWAGATPAAQYQPAGHATVFELAPPLQNTPAEQAAQADARLWPVRDENDPEAQLTFATPPPPQYWPAGHVTVLVKAPPPHRMPALHGAQLVRPAVAAKNPGAHCVQFAALLAPSAPELEPAGHDRHMDALLAPIVLE